MTAAGVSLSRMSHHHQNGHSHGDFESERMAATLEAEGELTAGVAEQAIGLCAAELEASRQPVRRVLDLGSGPGVATALLALRFPRARVTAVDASSAMLDRARARAARLGVGSRVATQQLDLDRDLTGLDPSDLIWAAMAIHHAEDEVATLTRVRELMRPGALLCLLERAAPMSLRLAGDLGRPGIWDRLDAARLKWFEQARATLPGAMSADRYPAMVAAAGYDVIIARTLESTVTAGDNEATHVFLRARLTRLAHDLAGLADPDDLGALEAVVEASAADRSGLAGATARASRLLYVARRARP